MFIYVVEEIWQCQFPRWSQQCFDIMTKTNDNLMVRDTGTLGSSRLSCITEKRLECCQVKDGNLCYFRAIQGRSGIPVSPELVKYTPIPYDWKKVLLHRGSQWFFSLFWEVE